MSDGFNKVQHSKDEIARIKAENLPELYKLISKADTKQLVLILERLGRLPSDFDGDVLLSLSHHVSHQVRFYAVKNLAKLANYDYAQPIFQIAKTDANSLVRREAASALGRMRDKRTIGYLLDLLTDQDPKVVLQAVRGLLVFKHQEDVSFSLKQLKQHPNEIIQSVITREFFSINTQHMLETTTPQYMRNLAVHGDVRDVLKLIPNSSIHLTFTSPPYYNARDYSIYTSYQEYLHFLADIFRELHRATADGRFFVLNTSPVIIPRVSRAHASKRYPIPFDIHPYLTEIGWDFIDDIIWMKPEASVKNRNGGFMQHRKPLAYKPNPVTEYIMVYRKKTDRLIDWNIKQYSENVVEASKVKGDYETSNVWKIDPTYDRVHTAVFPSELCRRVIQFYSYVGDLVFDPFAGSGTVGKIARSLNRDFFLVEQDRTYFDRISRDLSGDLFGTSHFCTIDEFHQILREHHDSD